MANNRTGEIDFVVKELHVSGTATLGSALALTQTVSGTNVSGDQTWTGGNAPVVTVGGYYFTFTSGASTFRVPCWPTT